MNKINRKISIKLLALDLNTCTRCTGTDANIDKALQVIKSIAEYMDISIQFKKTVVQTLQQAEDLQFISSPTIRINGSDIAFETMESKCDSCTDLCGCDDGTDCRVWLYQGKEYNEAPVAMVVEAILTEIFNSKKIASKQGDYEVPENLKRFFASTSSKESVQCCDDDTKETCCEPDEKASCCGAEKENETCDCV